MVCVLCRVRCEVWYVFYAVRCGKVRCRLGKVMLRLGKVMLRLGKVRCNMGGR